VFALYVVNTAILYRVNNNETKAPLGELPYTKIDIQTGLPGNASFIIGRDGGALKILCNDSTMIYR
jgi:hypothetical protein